MFLCKNTLFYECLKAGRHKKVLAVFLSVIRITEFRAQPAPTIVVPRECESNKFICISLGFCLYLRR